MLFGCEPKGNSVANTVISGKLINWGNASKILSSESLEADFGLGNDYILETDEEENFRVEIRLGEPTYYSLGRNKLYLSPGDQLHMEVDYRDPEAGVFTGDHANLQDYLSGVPFPKAGSYLSGGREVKGADIAHILELASSKTAERRGQLDQLTEAPEQFLVLEELRLKLDQINTILSFPIYGSFKEYWEYSEDKKGEVLSGAARELNTLADGIMQDAHMKHPNFRGMMHDLLDGQLQQAGVFSGLNMTKAMAEYDAVGALVSQLELSGLTDEMKTRIGTYIAEDHVEEYKTIAQGKLEEYAALELGEEAFDVEFKDINGQPKKLSEFKGKLIYVDLWATWCGPCIDELPAFEALQKEYAGMNIAFVPVSIDTNLDAWNKYLNKKGHTENEYIINRLDLSEYKVITIPRYFLIDKNFKIISVFATKPSDPKTRVLIDQHL